MHACIGSTEVGLPDCGPLDWVPTGMSEAVYVPEHGCAGRAEEGMLAAKQMLLFTPCDLFPWIKGRTLWLVGDSIQQACSCLQQSTGFELSAPDCVCNAAHTQQG